MHAKWGNCVLEAVCAAQKLPRAPSGIPRQIVRATIGLWTATRVALS